MTGYAYKWAKEWFMIGFGYSVNIFNGETSPHFKEDNDLIELFEERWKKENLGPIQYKAYLKRKAEEQWRERNE
ncbi:hypothetical protein LCGC14_2182160 [marine sediment metagenome]|uniref:Uncharacterized protein n=1 Tax=marine sediment metagenome TaxID=412755 RepID=A0A0F9DM23_9ZZZZ